MEFFEKWDKLKDLKAKVLLKHSLFGRQLHTCESLTVINDDRIGLKIKGQDIFILKSNVLYTGVKDNVYSVSDGKLTIGIILNKL